ncbi:DEAD/DEAH box helicase [Ruficoccus sp. ZRK36]|uniref:DEAD/DEAH box helicase n=1 Tax=Ruficoccus sp. ZRK36 TaxID=2866311 RepID=UPI001C72A7E1|nr:DEAD/DEAH box helicase [Ruficoccus sp. ZRK36]QYY35533.1 DEAD/DEAH box helicase [Ruficoccus sp. ZRK36]
MTDYSFKDLALAAPLERALTEKGYTNPSPIQAEAIPVLLRGHDLLACAQTGTGKTAAFALPMLQRLYEENRRPQQREVRTLVLSPTRELAVQIADSFRAYGKHMRLSVSLAYGGVAQSPQRRALKNGVDVLVATPGRLLDLYQQGCMDLSGVHTFVLDEADHMLDMGFIHDIRRIAKELPRERQTLMFSATMANSIAELAERLLKNPRQIRIAPAATTAEKVEQKVYFVEHANKRDLLVHLLNDHADGNPDELRLIFTKTKHGANRLATQLTRDGIAADAIHGNKSQAARQKALDRFRKREISVLVATDVAARGIDVKDITLVVNFDLPMEPDSYVHRIGRTARAGASGLAVSLCCGEQLSLLMAAERLIGYSVPEDSDHPFHAEPIAIRHRNPSKRRDDRAPSGKRGPSFSNGPRKKNFRRNNKHMDRKGRRRAPKAAQA